MRFSVCLDPEPEKHVDAEAVVGTGRRGLTRPEAIERNAIAACHDISVQACKSSFTARPSARAAGHNASTSRSVAKIHPSRIAKP